MLTDNLKFVCLHDSNKQLPYSALILGPHGRVVDWMELFGTLEEAEQWFKDIYKHNLEVGEVIEGNLKQRKMVWKR